MEPTVLQPLHTFTLVTRDRPGVLVRIALVFSRRGYNLESLAVSPGAVEGFARMTIVSRGDPDNIEQIVKQLAKLIDVVFVTDHRGEDPVETECALCKVHCHDGTRPRVLAIVARHGGLATDAGDNRVIVSMHGTSAKITEALAELRPFTLEELVRSGRIVMDRGPSHFAHRLGRRP
jgi:acetolactate synthase-1/3 small subunit